MSSDAETGRLIGSCDGCPGMPFLPQSARSPADSWCAAMEHEAADRDVTGLLQGWGAGAGDAQHELLPMIHAELRRLAGAHLRRERPNHTLQSTALVNEVGT